MATCTDPFTTQSAWESKWDTQSIVPLSNPTGTYSFPHTAIQAWLCESTNIGMGGLDTLNNSGILGNYFFSKVAPNVSNVNFLSVTAVDTCNMAEGVDSGMISSANSGNTTRYSPYAGMGAMAAIEVDMANINAASQTTYCKNNH